MQNNEIEKDFFIFNEYHPLDEYNILEKEKSFKDNYDNFTANDNSFQLFHSFNDEKNSIKISDITEKTEIKEIKENNYKKNLFSTKKRKNPGRKPLVNNKNKNLKCHDKFEKSNILKKLLTHFITFLITFSNDAIKSVLNEEQFKESFLKIEHNYKFKIKLNSKNNPQIKLNKIFDYPISTINKGINPKKGKNKNIDFEHNKKVFENIQRLSPILNEFFEKNILDIFKDYFFVDKNIKPFVYFKDIKIKFSSETKTFYDFLELKDNVNMKNHIIKVVNESYKCSL